MKARIVVRVSLVVLCVTLGYVLRSGAANADEITVTTISNDALATYNSGLSLAENLRLDEARPLFRKAITQDPNFAMAHYMLAAFPTGPKEALEHITTAMNIRSKVTEGERLLIESLHALLTNDVVTGEDLLKRVVKLHPRDRWAHLSLAEVYRSTNRNEQAIGELEEVTRDHPAYPPAYNLLGYANMEIERFDAAEAALKRYVELIPGEPNPHDSYAELLMKMGRFEESIHEYEKTLSIDPKFHSATIGIANNLILQGKTGEARQRLEGLAGMNVGATWQRSAVSGILRSYLAEGKFERAITEAKRRRDIGVKMNDPIALAADLTLIGTLELESNRVDAVKGTYLKERPAENKKMDDVTSSLREATRTLDKSNLGTSETKGIRLAILFAETENAADARDAATARKKAEEYRTLARTTGDPTDIQNANTLDAVIAISQNRFPEALDLLNTSNLRNPRNLFRLMEVYDAMGNKTKAEEIRQKISRINDGSIQFAMVKRWIAE